MTNREKILGKILAVCLTVLLWLNPALARVAIAEELAESSITTGDAAAVSETETTVNINQDIIPGEIITPPGDCTLPEGQTTCPDDIAIQNDNLAEVADTSNSSATTGENQIQGSAGDATIITGDATASGTIDNEINTNIVDLELSPTHSVELTVTPTVTPAPEEKTLTVENNNDATVTNEANISASTGENQANENAKNASIETGNALALANLINLLNTNIVGSNFEVLVLDALGKQTGDGSASSPQDIDLNALWQRILDENSADHLEIVGESSLSNLAISVANQNQANLENQVNVEAETGENQANENNNALIETGDATAVANVTNVVNTNILGSKFLFGIINILDPQTGDLILPRPEEFNSPGGDTAVGGLTFENQNEATVEGKVDSLATTGNNEENNNAGDSLLTTGNAQSVANNYSFVNTNIYRNNWFFLVINRLGNWTGRIFGWSTPEATETQQEPSRVYEFSLGQSNAQDIQIEQNLALVNFQNQNQATVKNNIQTTASTGNNQVNENQGDTRVQTGNARSIANAFNLVNLNILGSRWFMGIVNVLSDWTGNAIFAYPDVLVTASNGSGQAQVGETTHYTLTYKNEGHDEANDVWVRFELPQGLDYLGDTGGIVPEVSGQAYSWFLGSLAVGQEGSFTITVKINSDFPFENEVSFWSKFIPQAHAAENEKEAEIIATALIATTDPESNLDNNNFSIKTLVYQSLSQPVEGNEENNTVDQRQPILEISIKNNVNDFVYEGDTVTFEATVKNIGGVTASDVRFIQGLYNGVPGDFGIFEFDLGTIEPGKGGTLSFGLKLADDGLLPAGAYHTIAKATGNAPNGNNVNSNEARTDFNLRVKEIATLFEAKAAGKEEEILGVADLPDCPKNEEILPYVLLFLLSSLYISSWIKPRLKKLKNEKTN